MPIIDGIYYETTGAGRPVILIHCPALSHHYWRPVIERLQSACECVAFDIRGHGKSEFRGPWTFTDIAADIATLTRQLQLQRPVLVGYSSGGSIALEAARRDPELYAGMVLIGSLSECSTTMLQAKISAGLGMIRLGMAGVVGRVIAIANAANGEHLRQMLPWAGRVHGVALRSFLTEIRDLKLTPHLPTIELPALLISGTGDDIMHKYYRILRGGLPNARTVLLPKSMHQVPNQRPVVTADLIAEFVGHVWHGEAQGGAELDPVGPPPIEMIPGVHDQQIHP